MSSQRLTRSMLFLLLLGAISCMDESNLQLEEHSGLVSVSNGILEFPSRAAYDQVNQKITKMSTDELDKWEKSLAGFVSIRSIYNKAVEAQEAFLQNGGKVGEHPAFVTQHLGALTFISEDDMRPNLPPHTDMLSALVNEEGIVKIGSSIFEYRSGSIKEITDGDESKIKVLNNYNKSDLSQNIIVTTFTRIDLTDKAKINLKVAFAGNSNCTGYTTGGGQRVKGVVELFVSEKDFAGQTYYGAYVNVHATNQERKLGVWLSKRTSELSIVGDVTVGPDWGSFTVNVDTGGEQRTSIGFTHVFPDRLKAFSSYPYMYGSMTYYGRHGSSCSI